MREGGSAGRSAAAGRGSWSVVLTALSCVLVAGWLLRGEGGREGGRDGLARVRVRVGTVIRRSVVSDDQGVHGRHILLALDMCVVVCLGVLRAVHPLLHLPLNELLCNTGGPGCLTCARDVCRVLLLLLGPRHNKRKRPGASGVSCLPVISVKRQVRASASCV